MIIKKYLKTRDRKFRRSHKYNIRCEVIGLLPLFCLNALTPDRQDITNDRVAYLHLSSLNLVKPASEKLFLRRVEVIDEKNPIQVVFSSITSNRMC